MGFHECFFCLAFEKNLEKSYYFSTLRASELGKTLLLGLESPSSVQSRMYQYANERQSNFKPD